MKVRTLLPLPVMGDLGDSTGDDWLESPENTCKPDSQYSAKNQNKDKLWTGKKKACFYGPTLPVSLVSHWLDFKLNFTLWMSFFHSGSGQGVVVTMVGACSGLPAACELSMFLALFRGLFCFLRTKTNLSKFQYDLDIQGLKISQLNIGISRNSICYWNSKFLHF